MPLLHYTLRLLSYADVSPVHKCWAAHQAGVLADRLLALADGPGLRALPEPRSTAAQLLPNALTLAPGMHAGAYWWCFVDGDNPKVRRLSQPQTR